MRRPISIILSGVLSIGLATLLQYGFESNSGGYWILLFVGSSLLGWLIFVTVQKRTLRADVYALALLLLMLGASFFLRAEWFAGPLRVFLLFYGYVLLAEATYNGRISYIFWKGLLPTIFYAPIRYLTSFGPALSDIKWKHLKTDVDQKSQLFLKQWGSGILLTAPFLVIFIILLSGVNPLFADLFNLNWISDVLESLPDRVAPIALYTWLFWGCYLYMFEVPFVKTKTPFRIEDPLMDSSSISRSFLLIVLFFGVYLLVDLPYLWGGYDNFLSTERVETLAQYAKRGFYEILAVLVCSFIYIRVTDLVTKGQTLTKKGKILFGVLSVQLFLLLLSAFTRLNLYIAEYGWTQMRLLGMYYLILFSGGLAIMTMYRLKDLSWNRLERVGTVWVYLWLVGVSLLPNTAIVSRLHFAWSDQRQVPVELDWLEYPSPVKAAVYIDILQKQQFSNVKVNVSQESQYVGEVQTERLDDIVGCILKLRKNGGNSMLDWHEKQWEKQQLFNLNLEVENSLHTFETFKVYERNCLEYGLDYQ